jgi:hypothetical protein
MKKIAVSGLLVLCSQLVFSQINTDSNKRITDTRPVQINQARIIPSAKTTLIQKEIITLDMQLTQLSDSLAATKKEIDNAKETIKNKLDSLSEIGEMESLRLQMAMDRLSKLMSTLSNKMIYSRLSLHKPFNRTQKSVTQ